MRKIGSVQALYLLLLVLLVSLLSNTVWAISSDDIMGEIDDLKEQEDELSAKEAELDNMLNLLSGDKDSIIEEKSLIDQRITLILEKIENTTAIISQYESILKEKAAAVSSAKENKNSLISQYKTRLRSLEENGSATYLAVVFNSASFSDLLTRLDWLEEISASDRKMIQNLESSERVLISAEQELQALQADLAAEKSNLEAELSDLNVQSSAAQELIDRINSETEEMLSIRETYQNQEYLLLEEIAQMQVAYQEAKTAEQQLAVLQAAEDAVKKLENQQNIDNTVSSETEKENSNSASSSDNNQIISETDHESEESTATDNDNINQDSSLNSDTSVSFIRPVSGGSITSPFGERIHPLFGNKSMHYGIDIGVAEGTPIYAAAAGTVTLAGYDSSCGNWVVISHQSNYGSVYMHMTQYVVKKGQAVTQGQLIGYVGQTGWSTGPHLHFGITYNGTYVNPVDYIGSY